MNRKLYNMLIGVATVILFGIGGCVPTHISTLTNQFYGLTVINNPQAKDVGLAELQRFLQSDTTNEHPIVSYRDENDITSGYMCSNFAVDLHNNAEKAGIRCGIVTIYPDLPFDNFGHAFNVFNAADKGMVYVDAWTGTDNLAHADVKGNLCIDCPVTQGIGDS
jgi:hypothetical protein